MSIRSLRNTLPLLAALFLAGPAAAMNPDELAATRTSALQGSASAQLLLGLAYLRGDVADPHTSALGLHWLEQAALQGNGYAARLLGDEYLTGRHTARDRRLAADWLHRAARRGRGGGGDDAMACGADGSPDAVPSVNGPFHLLWQTLTGATATVTTSDHPLSTRALVQLANDGDQEAEYRLALDYRDGHGGLPRDAAAAMQWLTRAAAGGNPEAAAVLAGVHTHGWDSMAAAPRTTDHGHEQAEGVWR